MGCRTQGDEGLFDAVRRTFMIVDRPSRVFGGPGSDRAAAAWRSGEAGSPRRHGATEKGRKNLSADYADFADLETRDSQRGNPQPIGNRSLAKQRSETTEHTEKGRNEITLSGVFFRVFRVFRGFKPGSQFFCFQICESPRLTFEIFASREDFSGGEEERHLTQRREDRKEPQRDSPGSAS
jgi:hypothetical protein